MTNRASPTEAAEALARAIVDLLRMRPTDQAKRARSLVDEAKAVLAALGDAAIVEALKDATYDQLARDLSVSTSAINKAVSRHRSRQRGIAAGEGNDQ